MLLKSANDLLKVMVSTTLESIVQVCELKLLKSQFKVDLLRTKVISYLLAPYQIMFEIVL